jgi:hypothetical protein
MTEEIDWFLFTKRVAAAINELRTLGCSTSASFYAKANKHPELAEGTVPRVFEAERPQLVPSGAG